MLTLAFRENNSLSSADFSLGDSPTKFFCIRCDGKSENKRTERRSRKMIGRTLLSDWGKKRKWAKELMERDGEKEEQRGEKAEESVQNEETADIGTERGTTHFGAVQKRAGKKKRVLTVEEGRHILEQFRRERERKRGC
ncbi:hypothetical protein niasHT_011924 [Heterodera trifolii]|uniref:Uncharacterized protein n=1 Tax=Heterodera trifolii TaxID=157864 RepID=A0ABD2KW80_9BILA